jgi:hypothetical protein
MIASRYTYRTDFPLADKLLHRLSPFVDRPFALAMQLAKARFDQPVLLQVLRVFLPQLDLQGHGTSEALFSFLVRRCLLAGM